MKQSNQSAGYLQPPRIAGRLTRNSRIHRSTPLVWLALVWALCLCCSPATLRVGLAQETTDETTLDEMLEPATPTSSDLPGAATDRGPHTLLDTLMDAGFVGLLIGILSVVAVGFIIEHIITIRKSALMPEEIADELETMIRDGEIDRAVEACSDPQNESLIADVVLAGLLRFRSSDFGFAEYKAAVEEAGEDQTGRLYRKTEVLGVIGSIAPMLGLTGTVLGMIKAFNMIAATGGAARPDQLAGGIGQALVTTLMGLVVAIPAMIAFSYFRNRIDSIVAETGRRVEQLMAPLSQRKT